jgi:hypothetical protein
MKPAPVLATIEPVTATPMEMPNWRAPAASAPATPNLVGRQSGDGGVGDRRADHARAEAEDGVGGQQVDAPGVRGQGDKKEAADGE